MTKAVWGGATLAESDDIALVEGNPYFPADAVNWDLLRRSETTRPTYCHWKGVSVYYDVVVDGATNPGACWQYEEPYPESALIDGRVAFWNGVEIVGAPEGTGLVERTPSLRNGKTGWEALCWLLRHPPSTTLSAADITANTDIPEDGIENAWRVYDVQRYASRYKWRFVGGGGAPLRLEKTA